MNRWHLACALVPMLCGVAMVALLAPPPAASMAASGARAASRNGADTFSEDSQRFVGVVVAGNTAELAADADGVVAAVFVHNGVRVEAGDKLLQLDEAETSSLVGIASAELGQRRSELSRARAKVEAAEAQVERLRAGSAWISKQELDDALAQARLAEAELRAAGASVSMARAQVGQQRWRQDRRVLTAPFAGTVASLDVDPGDSVSAGQVVLRVLSDDRQVRFAFPPGELKARTVAVLLPGRTLAVEADVTEVRPEIDPSAQLVFATAALPSELPESARFIPGARVQVARLREPRLPEGRAHE